MDNAVGPGAHEPEPWVVCPRSLCVPGQEYDLAESDRASAMSERAGVARMGICLSAVRCRLRAGVAAPAVIGALALVLAVPAAAAAAPAAPAETATIAVGSEPVAVAVNPDTGTVYVTDRKSVV